MAFRRCRCRAFQQSLAERRARGKAARERAPIAGLGEWSADERRHDALETILAQNALRVRELVPLRHGRMSASSWNYYRGAAAVMAVDLATTPNSGIGVQLCGDAHVLNFGLWATPERNLSFDLRDFDETLPGPFEWDVQRLAASLVVVARHNGLAGGVGDDAVAATARGVPEAHHALRHRAAARDLVREHLRRSAARVLRGEATQTRARRSSTSRASSGATGRVREADPDGRRETADHGSPAEAHALRRSAPARGRPRGAGEVHLDDPGRPSPLPEQLLVRRHRARWWASAASACGCT